MKQSLKLLKNQAKQFFHKTRFVNCPAFPKEKISFNAKGLNHIFYKGSRQARTIKQARIRVKLLPYTIKLLKLLPVYQEERHYVARGKNFCFWSFEGIVDDRRIKVVVRQINNGQKHFWSIIPSWKRINGQIINAKSKFWKQ